MQLEPELGVDAAEDRRAVDQGDLGADPGELLELDAALTRLAERDAQMAQVVEMRWFAGMSVEDCAAALDQSPRTIARRWVQARAWLLKELRSDPGE